MKHELKRSLLQCFSARVDNGCIRCAKGHRLGTGFKRTVPINSLIRGMPLIQGICQNCTDYEEMGPPVPREERGWK